MVMIAPLRRQRNFMPALVISHAEELAYLWGRRRHGLYSDTLTIPDLQQLQERIEAHLQGVAVAAEATHELLGEGLQSDDRDEVFAAACALLRSGSARAVAEVVEAFHCASAARLPGLRDALAITPQPGTINALAAALRNLRSPAQAVAAAAILATQRKLDCDDATLFGLLALDDPDLARQAWQVLPHLPAERVQALELPYAARLQTDSPALRDSVLSAACWCNEPWVEPFVHKLAEHGDTFGLSWHAALTRQPPGPIWQQGLNKLPGPQRCSLLARAGHPDALAQLVETLSDADPATAAAAAGAFQRVTGLDVNGTRRTLAPRDDADEFEREFADEVWLPDLNRAQQLWSRFESHWRGGSRWCRGHEISSSLSSAAQTVIDLAARWDFGMRAALAGARLIPPPPVI